MNRTLSFFRVFDLAFFAPGGLFLAGLWVLGLFPPTHVMAQSQSLTDATGLIFAIVTLGLIYVSGLVIHGIQRVLSAPIWRLLQMHGWVEQSPAHGVSSVDDAIWYQRLSFERREDLSLYFWYLRATCWNLAVTILALAGLTVTLLRFDAERARFLQEARPSHVCLLVIGGLLAFTALLVAGKEYGDSFERASTEVTVPQLARPRRPRRRRFHP